MFKLSTRASLDKVFAKLAKKDKNTYEILQKKLQRISQDPYKFKPLRAPMQGFRRVHIGKSFVLVYSIDSKNKAVILEDFDHHDKIYT